MCGFNQYTRLKRFDNGVVIGRCSECGLVYTPVRLERPEQLLANVSLERLRAEYGPIVNGRFEHFRLPAFRRYLNVIGQHCSGKDLLDVGCAHGFFLAEARRAGYHPTGIEPSSPMAAFAREELGLEVHVGRADQIDLNGAEFDVITMTDSLEYFPEPIRDLRRLIRYLRPGGVLFVKVPNGAYFELRHRIATRRGTPVGTGGPFSPPERVAHYTTATLRALLKNVEMKVIDAGGFPPIDSPVWGRLTGVYLEMRAPWYLGLADRLARRSLHIAGMAEQRLSHGRNHLSQSVFAIAKRTQAWDASGY